MKILLVLTSFLFVLTAVCGDTFNTGANTNTVPGQLTVNGAVTVINGTNAQQALVYDTFTDSSNRRYFVIGFQKNSNALTLETENAGTSAGTGGSIYFAPLGVNKWQMATNGDWLSVTDAGVNIGAAASSRPSNVYVYNNVDAHYGTITGGSGVICGAGYTIGVASHSKFYSLTDGVWTFSNNLQNDFSMIQMGGSTASFPALKRSTTNLVARLADDSADTAIQAAAVLFGTNVLSFNGTNLTWNGTTITVP